MILKAGTYIFNSVITDALVNITTQQEYDIFEPIYYSIPFSSFLGDYNAISVFAYNGTFEHDGYTETYDNYLFIQFSGSHIYWTYSYGSFYEDGELSDEGIGWKNEKFRTITLSNDVLVDYELGLWFISNTNYNEVNAKPLAEITYNGETIAQLNAGETATLSCKDKKMASDVVISTNSEYKIPKLETAVVEPIPEVQIVKPSSGYDGFSQITVGAKTATPIEVGNATVMAMYLESAEVGAIYKYTGETTDTYENGSTYTVAEENGTKTYKKLVNDIGLGEVEHWRFKDVQTFMGETDDYYNFEGDGWCLVTIYGEFIINGSLCNRIKFEAYKIPNENLNFDTFTIWRQIHLGVFQRTSENSKLSEKPIRIYLENEGSITREEPYMGDFYILTGNRYPISIYQSDYDIAGIKETTTAEDWLSRVADRIS